MSNVAKDDLFGLSSAQNYDVLRVHMQVQRPTLNKVLDA